MKTAIHPQRQQGLSLIVALVFLIILAMLGVTAANVATQQERMAGHTRDRNIALQAAEAALKDAEQNLATYCSNAKVQAYAPSNGNSGTAWDGVFGPVDGTPCANCFTPALALPTTGTGRVAFPPEFYIEWKTGAGCPPTGSTWRYRVTARGVGASEDTTVILQAEFNLTMP
jgi:type IV pilus assembly protein PilX